MKKSILLIISIIFSLALSSCQSASITEKDATSDELSNNSTLTQTKTVSKGNFSNQTDTMDKQNLSNQTDTMDKQNLSNQTDTIVKDELANTTNKEVNFDEIFNNFLTGQTDAIDKDGQRRNIYYYLDQTSEEDLREYAVYDMNGDAIPELIIRSRISLDIFWIYNNELTLWYSDVSYTKPLNNMALLYEQAGGGPEHTNYMYIVLGYHGEELYKINFSEYSNGEVHHVQYDNKYFINDTEVTKEIYDSLSERFLNIGDDRIEWKSFQS